VNGDVVVGRRLHRGLPAGDDTSSPLLGRHPGEEDDIFAYAAGTGLIDSNFVPVLNAGPAWSVLAGPANTVYVGGAFSTVYGAATPASCS